MSSRGGLGLSAALAELTGLPVVSGYQGKFSSPEKSRTLKSAPCSLFNRNSDQKQRLRSSRTLSVRYKGLSEVRLALWAKLIARPLCTLALCVFPSVSCQ